MSRRAARLSCACRTLIEMYREGLASDRAAPGQTRGAGLMRGGSCTMSEDSDRAPNGEGDGPDDTPSLDLDEPAKALLERVTFQLSDELRYADALRDSRRSSATLVTVVLGIAAFALRPDSILTLRTSMPGWTFWLAAVFGAIAAPIAFGGLVGSSRVDLQACKLEYSIVSPK